MHSGRPFSRSREKGVLMDTIKKEHHLTISVSPHVKSEETTSRIMWSVSAALLPALIMGVYFFGPKALFNVALCIITALISEYFT